MTIPITQGSFEAFLKCARKSHLVSEGAVGVRSEFQELQQRLAENYREMASEYLRSSLRPNEWYVGTPTGERLHERTYRLVFDYAVAEPDVRARLHALEINCSRGRARHHSYTPIRFVPKEKPTASDKLMLAFDAFAFSRATGESLAVGKIIHGRRYSAVRFHLPKLLRRVRSIIEEIIGKQGGLAHRGTRSKRKREFKALEDARRVCDASALIQTLDKEAEQEKQFLALCDKLGITAEERAGMREDMIRMSLFRELADRAGWTREERLQVLSLIGQTSA